jgi:hypothetical protein
VSTTATASARIDVPPDAAWARFSLALGSTSGLTLAAWISAALSWPMWASLAAMAALSIAGAAVGLRALRAPVGTLRRHDEAWWWHHADQVDQSTEGGMRGDVVVTVDLGRWMLVRFEAIDAHDDTPRARSPRRRRRPLWLALSAGTAGDAAWSAWRALLLSRRATMPDRMRLRQAAVRATSAER